jgi:hypothetical protein
MNLKIVYLVLIIILSINSASAENLLTLYGKFIPEKLQNNVANRQDLDRVLTLYSQLDPDLLYFYIEDLNQRFNNTESEPDTNYRIYLLKYSGKIKYLKQQWAQQNIETIKQIYSPGRKVEQIQSYFTPYIFKVVKEIITDSFDNIDKNKQDFYTYIYLSENNEIEYNEEIDYSNLRNQITNELVNNFNAKFQNIENLSDEEITKTINSAFKYSFIFKDTYLSQYKNTTNFHIYELIDYLIKDNYLINNQIYAQLSYFPLPIYFEENIKFTDPFGDPYDYEYDIEFNNATYLNLGYKYKLKNETTALSYLDISVGIPIYSSYENGLQDTALFAGTKMMTGYWFTGEYFLSNERNASSFILSTQIATPIYYFDYNLVLEAGLFYSFNSLSFEYDFNREDTIISPGETPPEFYKNEVVKYDEIKHIILPVMSLRYDVSKNVGIKLEYIIPYYPKISFNYNLMSIN